MGVGGVLLTGTPPFKPRFWLGLAPPPPCTHARCRRLESARVLAVGASGRSRRDSPLRAVKAGHPGRCRAPRDPPRVCPPRPRSARPLTGGAFSAIAGQNCVGPARARASGAWAPSFAPPTHKRTRAGGGRLPGGAPGQVLWAARGLIIPPDLAGRVEAKIAGGRERTDSTASSAAPRGGCRRLGPAVRSGRALRQSRRGPVAPSVLCMRPAAHRSGLCGPGRANRQQLLRPPADLRLRLGRSLSESA